MSYDVIKAEVFRKAMEAIAKEMAITLMRTSGSTVVTDAKDFSTTLLDSVPEQIGFSGFVSFHVSTSILGIQAVIRDYGEDVEPGDVFLMNDPYTAGAIHQGDCAIAMPYFWRGAHVGWGHVNEHVLDIGGSSVSGFAPEARDCYSEALRFPPTRIGTGGEITTEWRRFIASNVRVPTAVVNDLQSMIAAHHTGERRLQAVLDDVGLDEFRRYAEVNKDLSEQLTRQRLARLPDGDFSSGGWVEYDGHGVAGLHRVELVMRIEGDEATFLFSGAPQTDGFINATPPVVLGQTMTTLLCQLLYDVPVNAGIWRPLHFELGPPGTVVNATPPSPVSQGHMETGMRINKLVCDAISQAVLSGDDAGLRARVAGEPANGSATTTLSGFDRRTGEPVVVFPLSPPHCQGSGAQTTGDGQDTYGSQCTLGNGVPAVEIEESTSPMMVLWRRIIPNSGGAGVHRGGQGISMGMAVVGADSLRGTAFNAMAELPARGGAGGLPGGASQLQILRETNLDDLLARGKNPTRERLTGTPVNLPAKSGSLSVQEGDVFLFTSSGGGGLGDPLLRDPELVAADVRDGFVTVEAAEEVYGVALVNDRTVDRDATVGRRRTQRAERIGAPPARAADPARTPGWSGGYTKTEDEFACGYCGTPLGTDYRASAVVSHEGLVERHRRLGMQIRPRPEGDPAAVLVRFHCPGCAYTVAADVTVGGVR